MTRRSETRIGLFRLVADRAGTITYRPVEQLDLPASFKLSTGQTWTPCEDPSDRPQFEGMVFDQTTSTLYAAQEDIGIWRIPLTGRSLKAGKPVLLEKVREFGQPAAYDSTFAAYRITPNGLEYRAGFQVVDGKAADGVQHSDGAAVTTQPLGPRYPHGLLAVHDGGNTPGDGDREGTNSKLVRLEYVP